MVWGGIMIEEVGKLVLLDDNQKATDYIETLEGGLPGTLEDLGWTCDDIKSQQDGAAIHTAKVTKKWLTDQLMPPPTWPASSPDMKIIEHVWDDGDKRVRRFPKRSNTLDQLWAKIETLSYETDPLYIRQLYEPMPRRLQSLIDVKGSFTKY